MSAATQTTAENTILPSLFVGHGSPTMIITNIPGRRFLRGLGEQLPTPRGIVVISAHWLSRELEMTSAQAQTTIHDFGGFPQELYEIEYPASGAQWLNDALSDALGNAGYNATLGRRPGLDHGAWVPLMLMYPQAQIPVVQLSLMRFATPEEHFRVGQALAALREQGILVIASGGLVHNLGALKMEHSATDEWAAEFDDWIYDQLQAKALPNLLDYRRRQRYAELAHPSDEHLVPLFVAMGAGQSDGEFERIHHSFSKGNISMTAYAFGTPDQLNAFAE